MKKQPISEASEVGSKDCFGSTDLYPMILICIIVQ